MFTRDNPYPFRDKLWTRNIQHNYEKMRKIVLSQEYDKVWVVESDTIPPDDALARLLEVDAPVVGGLYCLRHGPPVANVQRWGETLAGVGGSMSWEEIREHKGETVRTSGVCMGCVLIDRSAITDFSFLRPEAVAPDMPFMEYCFHNGILQMARLDVLCGHKKPDGAILWPQDMIEVHDA